MYCIQLVHTLSTCVSAYSELFYYLSVLQSSLHPPSNKLLIIILEALFIVSISTGQCIKCLWLLSAQHHNHTTAKWFCLLCQRHTNWSNFYLPLLTILYRKSIKFCILEGLILVSLITEFLYKIAEWRVIEGMH